MEILLVASEEGGAAQFLNSILPDTHLVIQAPNIRELHEILYDMPVDLVIIDEVLGEKCLPEFLPDLFRIRENLQIVVMASDPDSAHIRNALEKGASDVIGKPLEQKETLEKISKGLRISRLQRENEIMKEKKSSDRSCLSDSEQVWAKSHQTCSATVQNGQVRSLGAYHKALVNIGDIQELYEQAMEAVTEICSVSRAALIIRDGDNRLSVKASRGLNHTYLSQIRLNAYSGIFLWLQRNGSVLRVEDSNDQFKIDELMEIRKEAELLHSKIFVPLGMNGSTIGYISLGNKITGKAFDEEELESLFRLSGYMADAIGNARLHGQINDRKKSVESVLENIEPGIVAADLESKVIAINRTASDLLGISPEKAIGKHLQDLGSIHADILIKTIRESKPYVAEEFIDSLTKDRFEGSTSILRNEQGQNTGAVLVFLMKANNDGKTLKDLSDMMEHHIYNALTPISYFSQTMNKESDDPNLRKKIGDQIVAPSARIELVTGKLSDFADNTPLTISQSDLPDLLKAVIKKLGRQIKENAVDIKVDSWLGDSRVLVDAKRFSSAIKKILENSIESLEEELGKKEISITVQDLNGDAATMAENIIQITVLDNGVGIEEAHIDKAFEPFYTTKYTTGMGLGLPTARKIIEGHGGTVEIESTKDEGTKVIIRVPRNNETT